MEAADDEAVIVRVEEGQGEALVAAGVLERVEADEADPLDGETGVAFEAGRPDPQGVDAGGDALDRVEMLAKDGLEVATVRASREPGEPAFEPAQASNQPGEADEGDDEPDREAGDDGGQVVADDGVDGSPLERQSSTKSTGSACIAGPDRSCRRAMLSFGGARPGAPTSTVPRSIDRMAKRTRGSSRPGQRRRQARSARPAPTPRPAPSTPAPASGRDAARDAGGLTAAEEARAAALEAEIVAHEQPTPSRRRRPGDRPRGEAAMGGLAVRYAHEYDYVSRDLRGIAILATALIAILIAAWLIIENSGVLKA